MRIAPLALWAAVLLALAGPLAADEEGTPDPERILVLGPDGRPLPGVHLLRTTRHEGALALFSRDDPEVARSDRHGRIDALPPRTSDEAADGELVAWAPGLAAVVVPPGPFGVAVRLTPAESTRGRVRLARGKLAARREVLALPAERLLDLGHRTQTDAEGTFVFEGLAPGRWRLFLRQAGGRLQSLGLVTAGTELGERRPRTDTAVLGRLLDADGFEGAAVSGVTLRFEPLTVEETDPPAEPIEVKTDAAGRFRVDGLGAGVYAVRLLDPAWVFDGHAPHVDAQRGRVRDLPPWFALRRPAVTGTVRDADGKPLPGARLELVPDPTRRAPPGGYAPLPEPARSDEAGRFKLERVRPADGYRLLASRSGFSPWISNPFRVDRGRDTALKPFSMRTGWRLVVRVRDGRGHGIAGAEVRATAARRPSALEDPDWSAVLRTGHTDTNGLLELRDLPGDDAWCVITADGWLARTATVAYPRVSDHRRLEVDLEPAGELTGEVLVLDGGPPGPFVVEARTRDGKESHETTTGADGRFRFAALRDTATDFTVRSTRDRDGIPLAELHAVVPGSVRHLEIAVPALHAIRGTINEVAEDGPAPAVVVETLRYDLRTERYTWQAVRRVVLGGGRQTLTFEVGDLPPGAYAVRAVQAANDSPPLAVLLDTDDVEGLELVLPGGARVAGTVLDAESAPLLGAAVMLVRLHGDDPAPIHPGGPIRRHTDERGEYVFGAVAPGLWRVEARFPDAAPDVTVIRVLDGEFRVVRDLLLGGGGTLEGRVEDRDGRPLDGVHVTVRRFDGDEAAPRVARTNEEGRYRLEGLRPGAYRVRVRAGTVAGGAEVEAVIEVPAAGPARADFTAAAECAVEGTVLRGGRPVAGALIELVHEPDVPTEPLRRYRTSSDAAGRFRVEQLPPGRFRLQLQSGAWRTEQAFELTHGDRLDIDAFAFEGRLRGVVLTADGDPVPNAHVLARPLGEGEGAATGTAFVGEGRTDPRGEFTLRGLPVGAYALAVSAPGLPTGHLARVEADLPGADFSVEIVLGVGGTLNLQVRDESDRGVTGARVWVEDTAGVALHRHAYVTGAGGRLRIEGLPPGAAVVRVHARGMGRPTPRRVTIEEAGETRLGIVVGAAGTLRLIVTGEGADPLARTRVDIVRPGTREVLARRRPLSPIRLAPPYGHVPRTGIVDIPDLEEGTYLALVSAGRTYEPAEVPVEVRAGERSTVTVVLAPAAGGR